MTTFHNRRLPHYHSVGQPIFLTWRLHGSLPMGRSFPPGTTAGQAFVAMDRILDTTRSGPFYLRMPEIAGMVVEAIRFRETRDYELHPFVVMPNHVHLLITPSVEVCKVMQSLKRFTARQGNRILGVMEKPFWQEESYDRLVRDKREFTNITGYIEMNPVGAALAASPEEFRWSSSWPINNRPQVTNLPYID